MPRSSRRKEATPLEAARKEFVDAVEFFDLYDIIGIYVLAIRRRYPDGLRKGNCPLLLRKGMDLSYLYQPYKDQFNAADWSYACGKADDELRLLANLFLDRICRWPSSRATTQRALKKSVARARTEFRNCLKEISYRRRNGLREPLTSGARPTQGLWLFTISVRKYWAKSLNTGAKLHDIYSQHKSDAEKATI